MKKALIVFEKIDIKIAKQQAVVEVIVEMVKVLVKENASTAQSQDECLKKYEGLNKRYEEEYRKLDNLLKDKELRISKDKALEDFIESLKKQPMVVERRDESLWVFMIERAVVS